MLTLYWHPLSTFARRVRIALLEKDVEAQYVEINIAQKQHRSPEYLALNPYGRVPTLVDGDFVLFESTAILEYIEALHPTPALYPTDPKGRALAEMHLKLCDLEFTNHTRTLYFPARFIAREKWREEEMEKARAQIRAHLAVLDRQLEGKRFAVNDAFSIVEVCYAPFLDFLPTIGVEAPPNVAAWMARMQERPSIARTKLPR